ncbi:Gfo/Idh/MocA family protein [Fodinibius halophilus]|uniref:Gfo/Idh/MocA family oxidoreductase n=1 Tax=Fodinibius halophilus TaxID=1736908 RepID=A0A6M1T422_9BACT|nr:Gfo/Idh/MocA family oxidoreductase [Fodinibius halophilus]NGP87975.1 Gfo/Idh/MocA family oxidoreductase [Fodinibius halophilus]
MESVRWGILSTAKIAVTKMIPALQEAKNCTVAAISSRSAGKAEKTADKLDIPISYGSYDELLSDSSVDAIYNPLPNHLHVSKSIEALQQQKHVLCEKPISLNASEAQNLIYASQLYPDLKIMEAFMYRFHPQWKRTKSIVENGEIGDPQTIESFFSYYNDDPEDIRNNPDMGGGGLMDIGCYCISLSRFLFDDEPKEVSGHWKIDPKTGTDYLASGVLDFDSGTATFSCSTKSAPHQQVNIVGTKGRIVIHTPFNAPPTEETTITLYRGQKETEISFDPANQYTLQAEAFAKAILNNSEVPTPLEDAINNMRVIDRFRQNAHSKE